jgi:hypothetical protein
MNLFEQMFKAMGINPVQIEQQILHYQNEFVAMKTGFGNAMNHFNNRLTIIEAKQDRILALLEGRNNPEFANPQLQINGKEIHHDV